MNTQRYTQKKASANSSTTPAPTGQFAPRPFPVQTKAVEVAPPEQNTLNSQTKTDQDKPIGFDFAKISISAPGKSTPSVIQPKFAFGRTKPDVQRHSEEDELQMKPDVQRHSEEDELQMKPDVQRQSEEEDELQMKPDVQRQSEEEDELQMKPDVQRQSEEEDELQMKPQVQRHSEEEEELQMKPQVQRQSEEEDELQMKPDVQRHSEEEEELQMKPQVQRSGKGASFDASNDLESRINSNKGGGSPLPDAVRSFMEPRFGHSFAHVRVHTDNAAVQMNRELHAQAFTNGNHIFYGPDKSPSHLELTAHELTHTIQQTGGSKLQRQSADCQCQSCSSISPTIQRQIAFKQSGGTQDFWGSKLTSLVQRQGETTTCSTGCQCSTCNNVAPIQRQVEAGSHSSGCQCSSCNTAMQIQTKLTVGAVGDQYEQEADRVAAEVMKMPEPKPSESIQRHEEEELTQTKPAIQRQVAVQQSAPNVIQRHAAYEHYLLGQVAPDKLADLSYVRDVRKQQQEIELELAFIQQGMNYVSQEEIQQRYDRLKSLEAEKTDAKHTITWEMQRLVAYKDNPEAMPVGAPEPGKVKKAVDGKWQVPYVILPVKGDDSQSKPGDSSIVVSYSEINTFPDFFGNPETIANTYKSKVLALLQGVRQQSYIELANLYKELFGEEKSVLHNTILPDGDFEGAVGPRGQAVIGKAYEIRTEMEVDKATKKEKGQESQGYFPALERNACHFAPYSWDSWQKYHETALDLAQQSNKFQMLADVDKMNLDTLGPKPADDAKAKIKLYEQGVKENQAKADDLSNKALLQNAFGEHYLQDSFAGGHLIDKTKIMQWFVEWVNKDGKNLGTTDNAKAEWAMVSTIAQQDLKSNPQALDDKMHRGELGKVEDATGEVGLEAKPEIVFMMWWRNAALNNQQLKHLIPDEAAKQCSLNDVQNQPDKAKELMEKLVQQNFAKIKVEKSIGNTLSLGLAGTQKTVYSLNESMINVLKSDKEGKGKGAYEAHLAKSMMQSGEKRDFTKEAHEFNLAAYNSFLSNAYVGGATKYFHDHYCKEGLEVITGKGDSIGRIYGDSNMLNAGAQKGVQYSAETSQLSREAIFKAISGERVEGEYETKSIRERFPTTVIDPEKKTEMKLDKWNESLKDVFEKDLLNPASDNGARLVYKVKEGGGISKGNALDLKKLTKEVEEQNKVPQHGGQF
ncbi:DUF4157 domain-containing protein [Trichocoleus sp. FACHB-90]|uniref:eCIS core domain-containing protein n=1 Tax=Cyanophyceae TaxID=3028117 RepID=UPI00168348A3|nr:DUF4157 domain-containing protein [Trichocoleus sp. FACHB-90]MBD1929176.1 DUF4157 domain-containing protein [Trichocoleus sp. FACHB-90]